jgi:hypothetical protein
MTLRRLTVLILAVLAAATCLLSLAGTPARAALARKYEFSFGPLSGVSGIAVDDSTDDV